MAIIYMPHSTLTARCSENNAFESDLAACITRRVSTGVFVDESLAPDWLVQPRRKGLGDLTADGLAAIGITKERVSRALGRPCKCHERQAWLNRVGKILGIG